MISIEQLRKRMRPAKRELKDQSARLLDSNSAYMTAIEEVHFDLFVQFKRAKTAQERETIHAQVAALEALQGKLNGYLHAQTD